MHGNLCPGACKVQCLFPPLGVWLVSRDTLRLSARNLVPCSASNRYFPRASADAWKLVCCPVATIFPRNGGGSSRLAAARPRGDGIASLFLLHHSLVVSHSLPAYRVFGAHTHSFTTHSPYSLDPFPKLFQFPPSYNSSPPCSLLAPPPFSLSWPPPLRPS